MIKTDPRKCISKYVFISLCFLTLSVRFRVGGTLFSNMIEHYIFGTTHRTFHFLNCCNTYNNQCKKTLTDSRSSVLEMLLAPPAIQFTLKVSWNVQVMYYCFAEMLPWSWFATEPSLRKKKYCNGNATVNFPECQQRNPQATKLISNASIFFFFL